MKDRTRKEQLEISVKQLNRILKEINVDIDASISGANGGVSLVGFEGSKEFSSRQSRPEMISTIHAMQEVLYEVSRQMRTNRDGHWYPMREKTKV